MLFYRQRFGGDETADGKPSLVSQPQFIGIIMNDCVIVYFYSWKQKLKYLRIKDYDMCNLLSNNLEKEMLIKKK